MLVMLGASASGKTEIAKVIIKRYGLEKMITYTTRLPRKGEVEGKDYYFLSKKEFLERVENNFFIETTLYNDNYYGTAFKDAGDNKVLIVDMNGANVFYECLRSKVTIFFLAASTEIRQKRMILRGDHEEDIKKRLAEDANVFVPEKLFHIDYIIDTKDKNLEELAQEIYTLYISKIGLWD